MVKEHNFTLSEIDSMLPWEREVYISFINNYVEEYNKKLDKD